MIRFARRLTPLALILGLAAGAIACKENGYDYFDAALKLLGEAERGPCKLAFDQNAGQHVLDSDQIIACLDKKKEARAQLDKAKEVGLDTRELNDVLSKTNDEIEHLESMLRTVSRMEHGFDASKN